ncbi:xanthine dehydrogenase/oxidase [Patella vulgata]|uniref:xanthine dehydrogenase/oxidase n=1 Tax=Patella vulgata TaxID=6465 RepID=UPI0024A93F3E|nr:xanthine dehydrogenase/oxidase [Patella vulgata]
METKADFLIFFVNGEKVIEKEPDPTCTLLHYLRSKLQLTGSKNVCGEGGCGACTVMVSKYDDENNSILHYSVNACLTPVCSVHGLAVTTTEGIGSLRTRLHPAQEQIAKHHGSQCGFCTPGMVMSMYTLLRNNPQPSMIEIEKYLEGNLCRCTGYRPILDGYRTFSKEACAMGDNCCKNQTESRKNNKCNDEKRENYSPSYDSTQEPIFPPDLKVNFSAYNNKSLLFESNGVRWYRPVTLTELIELKHQYPHSKIIIGNTEVGIETRYKNMKYCVLIHTCNIPELTNITYTDDGIKIGASVTLSQVEVVLQQAIDNSSDEICRVFKAVVEMLKWFAGKQIRNTAAIGGNIMTASPISDLNPIFQACTAVLQVLSKGNSIRKVSMDVNFFQGYRQTVIKPTEVVLSVTIPYTDKNEYFEGYKQAIRKDDDIAIVNAGMRVVFEPGSNVIKDLYLSYGGMAPTTVMAKNTMQKLVGRKWENNLVPAVCQNLEEDLPLDPGAPGGIVEYRKTLTTSFFFKFYLTVTQQLYNKGITQENTIPRSHLSAIETRELGPSKGSQVYELVGAAQKDDNPIGRPVVHSSAYQHATGEAIFVDDMIPLKGELFVSPVYSSNHIDISDEPLFAVEEV